MHDIDWVAWALSLLGIAFKSLYGWLGIIGIVWAVFAMRVVREYRDLPREESESE